jgi:hypothetical protein
MSEPKSSSPFVGAVRKLLHRFFGCRSVQSGTPTDGHVFTYDEGAGGCKFKAAAGGSTPTLAEVLATTSGNVTGGHNPTLSSGDALLAVDAGALQLGGSTVATDVAPGSVVIQAQNAAPTATTHTTGADLILAAGVGTSRLTVTDAASVAGQTIYFQAPASATVVRATLVDGVDFTHSNVAATLASNIAGAVNASIDLGPYMVASSVGPTVYLTAKRGTTILYPQYIASGIDVTAGRTGVVGIADQRTTIWNETSPCTLAVGPKDTGASPYQYFVLYPTSYADLNPGGTNTGGIGYDYPAAIFMAHAFDFADEFEFSTYSGNLNVGCVTTGTLSLVTSGSKRWQVGEATGHLLAVADNTYDIGAAGATRPRSVYAGTSLNVGGVKWTSGTGSPEGAVTAAVGSIFSQTDGSASHVLWVKESGSGNTGWVNK